MEAAFEALILLRIRRRLASYGRSIEVSYLAIAYRRKKGVLEGVRVLSNRRLGYKYLRQFEQHDHVYYNKEDKKNINIGIRIFTHIHPFQTVQ
jgi:hypothetical protein